MLGMDAVLKGFEVPEVTTVIHYDIPTNANRIYLRQSRFQRLGRLGEIKMYALIENNSVLGQLWEKQLNLAMDLGIG